MSSAPCRILRRGSWVFITIFTALLISIGTFLYSLVIPKIKDHPIEPRWTWDFTIIACSLLPQGLVGIVGYFIWTVCLKRPGIWKGFHKSWKLLLLGTLTGILNGGYLLFMESSFQLDIANKGAAYALFGTKTIVVALMSCVFMREHLTILQWGGILVAVSGVVVISLAPSGAGTVTHPSSATPLASVFSIILAILSGVDIGVTDFLIKVINRPVFKHELPISNRRVFPTTSTHNPHSDPLTSHMTHNPTQHTTTAPLSHSPTQQHTAHQDAESIVHPTQHTIAHTQHMAVQEMDLQELIPQLSISNPHDIDLSPSKMERKHNSPPEQKPKEIHSNAEERSGVEDLPVVRQQSHSHCNNVNNDSQSEREQDHDRSEATNTNPMEEREEEKKVPLVHPMLLTFWMLFWTGAVGLPLLPLCLGTATRANIFGSYTAGFPLCLTSGCVFGLALIFIVLSYNLGPGGVVSALLSADSIFLVLLDAIFIQLTPSPIKGVGIGLILLGGVSLSLIPFFSHGAKQENCLTAPLCRRVGCGPLNRRGPKGLQGKRGEVHVSSGRIEAWQEVQGGQEENQSPV